MRAEGLLGTMYQRPGERAAPLTERVCNGAVALETAAAAVRAGAAAMVGMAALATGAGTRAK